MKSRIGHMSLSAFRSISMRVSVHALLPACKVSTMKIMPYKSDKTPGIRLCRVRSVDSNCDGDLKLMTASGCKLRLCERILLVLRADSAPYDGMSEDLSPRRRNRPL